MEVNGGPDTEQNAVYRTSTGTIKIVLGKKRGDEGDGDGNGGYWGEG